MSRPVPDRVRRRRRPVPGGSEHGEHGYSLVELMVATSLMLVVASVFGSMLVSTMQVSNVIQQGSTGYDELRVSLGRIERELLSASCIQQPTPSAAGPVLQFFTEANGSSYQVTYTVSGGTLTRQVTGGAAQVVGTRLVTSTAPFTYVSTPRRSVDVDLVVDVGPGRLPRHIQTTMAGRNAWRSC